MVGYATYADKLRWTPQQVDQLTCEQDDWLIPILQAFDAEREYQQKKAADAAERKAKTKTSRGYLAG